MFKTLGFLSSIRIQMALTISVFSLLVIVILFFLIITITREELKQQKAHSIKEEVHAYNLVISRQMQDFNYVAVDDLVKVLANSQNIIAIQVENEFGQEVSRSQPTLPDMEINFFKQLLTTESGSESMGTIRVWWKIPVEFIDTRAIFKKILLYSLVFLCILSVLIYRFLAFSVVKPLSQLEKKLHTLQPDEKFGYSPYLSKEIKSLQKQYGEMVARIRRQMQYLRKLASTDLLTDLPNRQAIEKTIQERISLSKKTGKVFSVLFLDIDHFKQINDVYGHAAGDQALKTFANIIKTCISEGDGLLGRFGGDEFVMVVFDAGSARDAVDLVYSRLDQEFVLSGKRLYLSTSIGIANWPVSGDSTQELLKSADIALYQSKQNGRNQASYFSRQMQLEVKQRLRGMDALKSAMKQNRFIGYWQPIVNALGEVVWHEVLIRLEDESGEIIKPNEFLPSAEESGLMKNIAMFSFQFAYDLLRCEKTSGVLSINLSRSQLLLPRLLDMLSPLEPWKEKVIIEITEEAFLGGCKTKEALISLSERGFKIALDDFGSGYSSLAVLLELPVDIVKLDKEFQTNIHKRDDARAMLNGIISMLHMLGKEVVAEGIQNESQYDFAMASGCNYLQGYYLHRPKKIECTETK